MKSQFYLTIVLFFFLSGCSNKGSETTSSADSLAAIESEDSDYDREVLSAETEEKSKTLTIRGKDIWVRDEPGVGNVVMKLNEGNHCKITGSPRQFEIIRGQAHKWYPVEFNGKTGWVFGAQTDRTISTEMISAANVDQLWEQLKESKRNSCVENNKIQEEEGAIPCTMHESGEHWLMGSIESDELGMEYVALACYLYGKTSPIQFPVVHYNIVSYHEGAMGWATFDHFLIGFRGNKDALMMYVDNSGSYSFDGRLDYVHPLGEHEFLLVAYDEMKGIPIEKEFSYKVYYVNETEVTARLLATLGLAGLSTSKWGWYSPTKTNSEVFADSIRMEFPGGDPPQLRLIQHRVKLKDNDDPEKIKVVPVDTLVTMYRYDKKNRTLVQK